MPRPCVLAVHAHPDDESSKGAATMAKYAAEGVRTVLVTCTGGEAGDVTDTSLLDAGDLAATRARELEEAVRILDYGSTYRLGYPDSGMRGDTHDAFATASFDEVVEKLVKILRVERPDVVVTYDPWYAAGHPDHLRSYEATRLAFEQSSTSDWQPAKLYGCRTHAPGRLAAMHGWLQSRAMNSPYEGALASAGDDLTTTRVDVSGYLGAARRALQAHRSQVEPDEAWFFAVPLDALIEIHPWDDYQLLISRVAWSRGDSGFESDLLAGID